MAGSVNKVILVEAYVNGASLPELSIRFGVPLSTARYHVLKAGVLRSRSDGVRNAAEKGRLGSGFRGKRRTFSPEHCGNISKSRLLWGEANATGLSKKPSGYIEYTRGPNKGRTVHVVKMEERIGRHLREDEVVHHIDGDRSNNKDDNLALVTRSGHTRLHRFEDKISNKNRERTSNGRFC